MVITIADILRVQAAHVDKHTRKTQQSQKSRSQPRRTGGGRGGR